MTRAELVCCLLHLPNLCTKRAPGWQTRPLHKCAGTCAEEVCLLGTTGELRLLLCSRLVLSNELRGAPGTPGARDQVRGSLPVGTNGPDWLRFDVKVRPHDAQSCGKHCEKHQRCNTDNCCAEG